MENQNSLNQEEELPQEQKFKINPHKLQRYHEKLREEQNLTLAIAMGGLAALAGAVIWALITVLTGYQIGFMAIGVGLLVGFAVRISGNGIDPIFGYLGAGLALLGCLLGNVFTIYGTLAQMMEINFFEAFGSFPLSEIPTLIAETFSPIDLLFYGLAIYEGYRFAFRPVNEEDILAHASEPV